VRISRTRSGEYYASIPVRSTGGKESAPGVIALDPGVRTFMTGYDPSGKIVEWGAGDMRRIEYLARGYDNLMTRAKSPGVRHRQRYKMLIAGRRILRRIRRLVDDLHKKMATWLCRNYQVVLIPRFEIQGMVKKGHRKIRSHTARAMMTWGHYRFRMRLMTKAREYQCLVHEVTEEYTSQGCGQCGARNAIGGSKTYLCNACGFMADRDHNGARNILLKFLA